MFIPDHHDTMVRPQRVVAINMTFRSRRDGKQLLSSPPDWANSYQYHQSILMEVVMGIRKEDEITAMCLETDAAQPQQDNRPSGCAWLICCAVDTSLMSAK